VGTADSSPGGSRWFGDIIRRLVGIGFVVHSHFHEIQGISLVPYRELAAELENYHFHPIVDGTVLSETISRYDLMGVFHELDTPRQNESATLAVCMPTKAVCGWFHGAIPVVCFPHYRGLAEWINEFGIGFVVSGWDELRELRNNQTAIVESTRRCMAVRDIFSNEWNAARIQSFVHGCLARKSKSIQLQAERQSH
jgi:hypothetical protein